MWTELRPLLAALCMACTGAPSSPPSPPAPSGTIVFHRGDPPRLCTVDAAGGDPRCEQQAGRFAGPPRPGAAELAALETRDELGQHEERLVRWSGPGAPTTPLTPWAPQVRSPTWSPDGAQLAVTTTLGGVPSLFTLPAGGTSAPVAVHEHAGGSFEPDWHPDGSSVVFASSRDGNAEIYAMTLADGTLLRLTDHPGDDLRPRLSRAGKLAWLSDRGGLRQVHTIDNAIVNRMIADNPHPEVDLAWSPTDARLAVLTGAGPDTAHVLIVDGATGAALTRIEHPELAFEHPTWSPDGSWLALSCRRGDAQPGICVASAADGSVREVVADVEHADWLPRWLQG